MSASGTRVPLALALGLVGFVLGLGGGAAGMMGFGYRPTARQVVVQASTEKLTPASLGTGGSSGSGSSGRSFRRELSSKERLAILVTKLDQLTQKSFTVELTDDQKKAIHNQLEGLADKDDIAEDDAKDRLEKIADVLKDKKDTFKAMGFDWPGDSPLPRAAEVPNPFKDVANAKHLKALETVLVK
jgi:hypothetical protein